MPHKVREGGREGRKAVAGLYGCSLALQGEGGRERGKCACRPCRGRATCRLRGGDGLSSPDVHGGVLSR